MTHDDQGPIPDHDPGDPVRFAHPGDADPVRRWRFGLVVADDCGPLVRVAYLWLPRGGGPQPVRCLAGVPREMVHACRPSEDWSDEAAAIAREECAGRLERAATRFPDQPQIVAVLLGEAEDIRARGGGPTP